MHTKTHTHTQRDISRMVCIIIIPHSKSSYRYNVRARSQTVKNRQDKVVTKCWRVRYTVDVGALRAKVWILHIVKCDEAKEVEEENDGEYSQHQTKLLDSVPLANVDVGHKDEGGEEAKDEASNLRKIVNVGQSAEDWGGGGRCVSVKQEINVQAGTTIPNLVEFPSIL